jgi:hypothetical protein
MLSWIYQGLVHEFVEFYQAKQQKHIYCLSTCPTEGGTMSKQKQSINQDYKAHKRRV